MLIDARQPNNGQMANHNKRSGIPRSIEVVMAGCGLLFAAPVIALCAAFIKISSSGSILFRQCRVGQHGKDFTLLKLRTMSVNQNGPMFTAAGDARVTPVGRVLRKTKIDELPGLWNVIRGDMSFVGPRPEVPELVDLKDPRWIESLHTRPGITDPVTLRLRNEESILAEIDDKERFYREVLQPYKLEGYLQFVRERTWKIDLGIITRTLKATVLPYTVPPPTEDELRWSQVESI